MSDVGSVRAALRTAAQAGPYFAVESTTAGDDWHPVADLWQVPGLLAERVAATRSILGERTGVEVDVRAAASTASLGFVSRLVSPALGTACAAGVVPRLDPHRVWWRPVLGGPVPLAGPAVDGASVGTVDEAAAAIERDVLQRCVEPVIDAYAEAFRLSTQVLRGNVASALAGAAGMLGRAGLPLLLDPVGVVQSLLASPWLAEAGHYERGTFVRHNCCLFYRVPGGGTCGDCVLTARDAQRGRVGRM